MDLSSQVETEFLALEKRLGLCRKWAVMILGIISLWLFYPDRVGDFNRQLFVTFVALYGLYSIYVLTVARGMLFRVVWQIFYLVELTYLSYLIFFSQGMDSVLILLYPTVLIGNALVMNEMKSFIMAGIIAHVSYAATLLIYYNSLAFYLEQYFWVQCLGIGAVFALGVFLIRLLQFRGKLVGHLQEELLEMECKLEAAAIIDELSGLYKPEYFIRRLQEEVNRARRYGNYVTLLLIDIDYFRNYDDFHGQKAGDVVIRRIARAVLRLARETDICCRYGSDQMAVILPCTPRNGGNSLAERIRKAVEELEFQELEQQPGGILTVSIGVASYPDNADNAEYLLRAAEKALRQGKEDRKNRTRPYLSLIVGSQEHVTVERR